MKALVTTFAIITLSTLSCGKPPEPEPPVEPAPTAGNSFSRDVQPIFEKRCGGCHIARSAGGLSLKPEEAFTNLMSRSSRCDPSVRLVSPGAPAQSQLWRTLSSDADGCGNAMPLGTAGLQAIAPEEFAVIERWIIASAPND